MKRPAGYGFLLLVAWAGAGSAFGASQTPPVFPSGSGVFSYTIYPGLQPGFVPGGPRSVVQLNNHSYGVVGSVLRFHLTVRYPAPASNWVVPDYNGYNFPEGVASTVTVD